MEENHFETVKLILPIVKDLIVPKITNSIVKFNHDKKKLIELEEIFESYLSKKYDKYLIIDTLVFPNKQTLLKLLYEPLIVQGFDNKNKKLSVKIDSFKNEFLPEYLRIIIEDTAGMGKSTIVKKLFLSIIEEKVGIPMIIELSQIDEKNNILSEILSQLSPLGVDLDSKLILDIIESGDFIFLLDGFDEISLSNRNYVHREIKRFIVKANENQFLITSRPEGSLVSFGDFKKFNIKPLTQEEAFSLIKRYDFYAHKSIADELIAQLKSKHATTFIEYLSNPFLVSLLYKSFDFKKDIPIKKSHFYQQVFDALFENHDLSKEGYLKREKNSNLHIDDFERVLRYLAYFTSIENEVKYDKNAIIQYIEKTKKFLPELEFKSTDFLNDLIITVPVFKKEGLYYKWSHKSLQDYFAAKFLWIDSKENQKIILNKIYHDKENRRFYNVLDIFYELDTKTFKMTILFWFLKEFKDYADENYKLSNKEDAEVKTRVQKTFLYKDLSIIISKKEHTEFLKRDRNTTNEEVRKHYNKNVPFDYSTTSYSYTHLPGRVLINHSEKKDNLVTIYRLLLDKNLGLMDSPNAKRPPLNLGSIISDVLYMRIKG